MSGTSSSGETESALAEELRAIRLEMEHHNRIIRRNRRFGWGLGAAFLLAVTLGIVGYVDDRNDDRRECQTDNENSIRDSEVLIGAALAGQEGPDQEMLERVERYREDVRRNLRDC